METVQLHRCETCVYHLPGESPCTGRCGHPGWQPSTGVIRFVRDRECACYGGWGIDFWRPRRDDGGPPGFGGPAGGSGGGPGISPMLAGGRVISLMPWEQFERLYPSRAQQVRDRLRPSESAAIADEWDDHR
jgi:hypothetical protein